MFKERGTNHGTLILITYKIITDDERRSKFRPGYFFFIPTNFSLSFSFSFYFSLVFVYASRSRKYYIKGIVRSQRELPNFVLNSYRNPIFLHDARACTYTYQRVPRRTYRNRHHLCKQCKKAA